MNSEENAPAEFSTQTHEAARRTSFESPCPRKGVRVPAWILPLALLIVTGAAHAQTPGPGENRAGVIVIGPDGEQRNYCVAFPEDSLTGEELLARTGLEVKADLGNSLGVAVCSLDGQGCDFPRQSCFCQCKGGNCQYWAYFINHPERGWIYSALGARARTVRDGDMDAWVWTSSASAASAEPAQAALPAITAAALCAESTTPTAALPSDQPTAARFPAGYLVFAVLLLGLGGWLFLRRKAGD